MFSLYLKLIVAASYININVEIYLAPKFFSKNIFTSNLLSKFISNDRINFEIRIKKVIVYYIFTFIRIF